MKMFKAFALTLFVINLLFATPQLDSGAAMAGDWGDPVGHQLDGSMAGDWGDPVG